MSLLAVLSQQGDSIDAHNSDPAAHGFGVYTVAQLNAFMDANRPIGCVYCSDCLTPEGVGAPVVWSGTRWVTTCSGTEATTDLLIYFRSLRLSGKSQAGAAGSFWLQSHAPFGQAVTAANGASAGTLYDGQGAAWLLGSSASASVRDTDYTSVLDFGPQSVFQGAVPIAAYCAEEVWFTAASDAANEYSYRRGFVTPTQTAIGAAETGLALDRGNQLGALNAGSSGNWIAYTRLGGVNAAPTVTGLAPATSFATRQLIETIMTPGRARHFIAGNLVADFQAGVPADAAQSTSLSARSIFLRHAGTTERRRMATSRSWGVRY